MIVYKIFDEPTGLWSRGGGAAFRNRSYGWTPKVSSAKTWKTLAHLKAHLSQNEIPDSWLVVEFEVKTTEGTSFSAAAFMKGESV